MCTRDRIIRYAKGAIGCAYDWTPSGGVEGESYNCSFLTFCAYRYAGLEIPTWQGHQNGNGSQSDWVRWNGNLVTEPNLLKAGDLVFFSNCDNIRNTYHVGISLGGTRMIDSVPSGGVQERELYDTFIGGGWPLPEESEPVIPLMKEITMEGIISVENRNTLVYYSNGTLKDLTDIEDLEILNKISTAFVGIPMRIIELTEDEYARLCQICRAGMPTHLQDLNTLYPPRS